MATILAMLALFCVPGLWAIYVLGIRRAPRPWAVRIALSFVFLSGCSLGLTATSGAPDYPPELIFRTLAAPVIFALGPLEAIPVGAYTLYAILTLAIAAWATLCTRLPRALAFIPALLLGAATITAAAKVEDRVQAHRITQAAARADATCFQLRHSFSDTLNRHWRTAIEEYVTHPSHARATIDGTGHIWSYRQGRFIVPDRPIDCVPDQP